MVLRGRVEREIKYRLVHVEIAMLVGKDWEEGEGVYQTDHWKGGLELRG